MESHRSEKKPAPPLEEEVRSAARRSLLRRSKKKPAIKVRNSACADIHLLHAWRRDELMEHRRRRGSRVRGGGARMAARGWSSEGRRGHRAPARSSSSGEVQAEALSGKDQDLAEALNPLSSKDQCHLSEDDIACRTERPAGRSGLEGGAKSSPASEDISKLTLLSGQVQTDTLSGEDQDLPEVYIGGRAERPAGRSGLEVRAA